MLHVIQAPQCVRGISVLYTTERQQAPRGDHTDVRDPERRKVGVRRAAVPATTQNHPGAEYALGVVGQYTNRDFAVRTVRLLDVSDDEVLHGATHGSIRS